MRKVRTVATSVATAMTHEAADAATSDPASDLPVCQSVITCAYVHICIYMFFMWIFHVQAFSMIFTVFCVCLLISLVPPFLAQDLQH